jgi:DNA-binding NarL/FixJ family response regulator
MKTAKNSTSQKQPTSLPEQSEKPDQSVKRSRSSDLELAARTLVEAISKQPKITREVRQARDEMQRVLDRPVGRQVKFKDQVQEMRKLAAEGRKNAEIGRLLGCSSPTVKKWLKFDDESKLGK